MLIPVEKSHCHTKCSRLVCQSVGPPLAHRKLYSIRIYQLYSPSPVCTHTSVHHGNYRSHREDYPSSDALEYMPTVHSDMFGLLSRILCLLCWFMRCWCRGLEDC